MAAPSLKIGGDSEEQEQIVRVAGAGFAGIAVASGHASQAVLVAVQFADLAADVQDDIGQLLSAQGATRSLRGRHRGPYSWMR